MQNSIKHWTQNLPAQDFQLGCVSKYWEKPSTLQQQQQQKPQDFCYKKIMWFYQIKFFENMDEFECVISLKSES